ncbi:MAG TPA: DUF503 domain-containing protein [Deltaproteobacteria bacterium]|nr:DUF503 domain-containing protein [Deltaproteobacteria bacterium]
MVIGACEVRLRIEGARSLKEKRKVLKSMRDRIAKMNLSVSEVDDNEKWQAATMGIVMVSNDVPFVNSVLDRVVADMEESGEIEVIAVRREILHL